MGFVFGDAGNREIGRIHIADKAVRPGGNFDLFKMFANAFCPSN